MSAALLYHFTCSHMAPLIERDGRLVPKTHPAIPGRPLVWLTDMPAPDRRALGLTSFMLLCDRTEWRCTVDVTDAEPWESWWPGRVDARTVSALTFCRAPARWWVSQVPVDVLAVERVAVGAAS